MIKSEMIKTTKMTHAHARKPNGTEKETDSIVEKGQKDAKNKRTVTH